MQIDKFSDLKLTKLVQEDSDDEALKELVVRHSGIYMDMLKAYGAKSFNNNQLDDFIKQKDSVIYEAALDYNPERAKFSTFLANKTKYMCLSERTKFQKLSREVSYDDMDWGQSDTALTPDESCVHSETINKIMDMIESYHDQRVTKIFHLRYFGSEGRKMLPWKEVAKHVSLSAQSCINIHNKTLEIFKNRVKNEQTIEF
jgi:DNA-directed RNA polymerase specialized sigma subunit